MPVYSWKGTDLKGKIHTGVFSAESYKELEGILERRSIGLISARSVLRTTVFSSSLQQTFFSQLSSLLLAHIPLYDALIIIASCNKGSSFEKLVRQLACLIAEGMPLSEALLLHMCVDQLAVVVIRTGEKTGDIAHALEHMVKHKALMELFKKKLYAALFVPGITLCFFMMSFMGIFLIVIPRFEFYCTSLAAPLPYSTHLVIGLSRYIRSWNFLYGCGGLVSFLLLSFLYSHSIQGYKVHIAFLLKIAPIRSFLIKVYTTQLLRGLAFLLGRGIPLVQALEVCGAVQSSVLAREEIAVLKNLVEQGKTLSYAVSSTIFSSEELNSFILLGESTGKLSAMIDNAATVFQHKVYSIIDWYIVLINPILLVSIGLLIAGLMCAVYMPLITFPLCLEL
ncbi:type II secretion system F family protein [Candidatus Dependentiae bacterium]|nr:type II secretion system F family protein [Candidatus Dependentiae bacterium]